MARPTELAAESAPWPSSIILGTVGDVRRRRAAVVAAALAGSQLGHAIVYVARFGGAAATVQATGAHAYYPAVAGVLSGVVGGGLLAILGLLAASRIVAASARHCMHRRTTGVLDVLPLLVAAQLFVFMGQESIEAMAAGLPVPSALELLLWGTLGQLPAALLAA